MDYKIHNWNVNSLRKLDEFFNERMLQNCVISGANNVIGHPHMGCISKWFEKEQDECGYKGEIKACIITVNFRGSDYFPADLDTVTGIVHLIGDYFCDYQNFFGLFKEDREYCVAYFVINPLNLRYGAPHPVSVLDITNLCHMSRLDRSYRGFLKPLFPLGNLLEDDDDDFDEEDDDLHDEDDCEDDDWCDEEDFDEDDDDWDDDED